MNRILRTPKGIQLELEEGEAGFLRRLPQRVRDVLQGSVESAARRRLLPVHEVQDHDAHGDDVRALMEADLLQRKLDRLYGMEESLAHTDSSKHKILLSEEDAERWLMVLTDLRLILADAIGIEDEDWPRRLSVDQRASPDVQLYAYLSNLQGTLLEDGFGIAQPPM